MKPSSSMHNHTTLCDGANTPREMADAAIAAGLSDFGFSGHSNDPTFPKSLQDEPGYIAAINELKKEYEGRLRIYCGIESDYLYPTKSRDNLDFIVGSVHNIPVKGPEMGFCIDNNQEIIDDAINRYYDGDGVAMARDFYECTVDNAIKNKPDIFGHFDIILKLNADNRYFDESSKRYMDLARAAAAECARVGGVFEINTGGVYKSYRDFFYPKRFLLEYLCELGAHVCIDTDSHAVESISFGMSRAISEMKAVGFRSVAIYENGGFVEKDINLYE